MGQGSASDIQLAGSRISRALPTIVSVDEVSCAWCGCPQRALSRKVIPPQQQQLGAQSLVGTTSQGSNGVWCTKATATAMLVKYE